MLQNIIELTTGINKVTIDYRDLSLNRQTFPIARLPSKSYLYNLTIDVIRPFKGSPVPSNAPPSISVSDINSYSFLYRFKLGKPNDTDYYMTEIEPETVGEYGVNSGSYFSSPVAEDVPVDIYLESNVIPRTWTFGGFTNTPRRYSAGAGTQTASLYVGGSTGTISAVTEEYNGTSWASANNINTANYKLVGCGTQSAGLIFNGNTGSYAVLTEEYDGTSWANGNNANVARQALAGCGIQTAALSFGGSIATKLSTTEEYDGTSWVVSNTLNEGKDHLAGNGTQTAGLTCGGYNGSAYTGSVEEYDGSVWSVGIYISAYYMQSFGVQGATVFLAWQGEWTFEYDGTSYMSGVSLNYNSTSYPSTTGMLSAGLLFGTNTGYDAHLTEEYNEIDPNSIAISGLMTLNFTVS